MRYYVSGYVANDEMLRMLHHHLLGPGWPDDECQLVESLTEARVLNERGWVVKVSGYFGDMLNHGYLSNDYGEWRGLNVATIEEAAGIHWIYGPAVMELDDGAGNGRSLHNRPVRRKRRPFRTLSLRAGRGRGEWTQHTNG